MLGSLELRGCPLLPVRPPAQCFETTERHFELAAQKPDNVGSLGQEPVPALHTSHCSTPYMAAASTAVMGIVISQARPISRTISQWTWRNRFRPRPTPTTDDATTWVV